MKLTVFAGTFNPIHIAHLILAESVRTLLDLDKIVFIPSYMPPHRENELADAYHRLKMVKLSVCDNPNFEVSDIEFQIPGKSYTVNTIKALYSKYPDIEGKINFIIGADAFLNIETWHKPDELIELVNFIILARQGTPDAEKIVSGIKFKNINCAILETPVINISSTYIRNRIIKAKSIKYLVKNNVEEYILQNNLYILNDKTN
ncbi:MAG TPA: nicotinate (nicotinamide) nucleotide adenylyltransferase [Candidatus Gastranaerophilales bacterium]|nr:nicotinate (nicotinamide) nucleotide adenylyltransferase [Candidatus Gastranaerophilales bacterium]